MMHRWWWRGLAIALLAACSGSDDTKKTNLDVPPFFCDVEGASACRPDRDCGDGLVCSDGCCLPACASADDCSGCGRLGCVCDEGACRDRPCSADLECPDDLRCSAGSCIAAAAAEQAFECVLEPRYGVLRAGASLQLHARARSTQGPLLLSGGFTFESSDPDRAMVDEAGLLTGGAEEGEVEVTARIGATSCKASFRNHRALAEDELRVVLVDELSGLPIEGAPVQIETGATPLSVATDARGSAIFSLSALPEGARTISAFSESHAWITVSDVQARDLLLPVRRLVEDDLAGGFYGRFLPPELFHPDHVHAGLAGSSIPGNLLDLDFSLLVGPSQPTKVTIGSEREVPLPSGVVLGLGNTWFKEEYEALALPGACEDREASQAGRCGRTSAWGVAGGVPLLDLPIDELTEEGADVDPGTLLAELLPHFRRFRSAVVSDVKFALRPGEEGFERLDLRATQRMALRSELSLPLLPQGHEARLDGAVIFAGADLPGRGIVPLGITAGVDEDPTTGETDGRIEDPDGSGADGLTLRLAPQHGGLEGSDYVLLAVAANFAAMASDSRSCSDDDRSGCPAISALVQQRQAIGWEERIDLSGESFVGLAREASWDAGARTLERGAIEGGANLFRLKLTGPQGRTWNVWFEGDSVVVPESPGSVDRAADARAAVQALRSSLALGELFGFEGGSLVRIVEFASGFSSLELPR